MDNDAVINAIPFAASVGIDLKSFTPEEVIGTLTWSEAVTTTGGSVHGGAIMTLADTIAAICAALNLPAGATTTTTASNTVFTRAARSGTITATAHPIHRGRSTIVVVTEICNDAGDLIAQTTQTQAVLTPPQ